MKAKHWDCKGNPILGMFEMRDYYKSCQISTKTLSKYLPHQYVVIPDIEIRFYKTDPYTITFYRVFPAGSTSQRVDLNERQVQYLRVLYSGKVRGWKGSVKNDLVILHKSGKVIPHV